MKPGPLVRSQAENLCDRSPGLTRSREVEQNIHDCPLSEVFQNIQMNFCLLNKKFEENFMIS